MRTTRSPLSSLFGLNPVFGLQKYILMTAGRGSHLFWTLPGKGPMKPLASGTINAITTRFLHANGLSDFTAHSTRGAAATTLLARGVPPPSGSTAGGLGFGTILSSFFYNRLQATKNWAQVLVPKPVAQPCPLRPDIDAVVSLHPSASASAQ